MISFLRDWVGRVFAASATGPDVVIVDHSLMDAAGHHLNVTSALNQTFRNAGLQSRVIAHKAFDAGDWPDLKARSIFPNRAYDAVGQALERPNLYAPLARKFETELTHVLRDATETVIVLPTVTFVELPGLAAWAASHPSRDRLKLYFWLVFGPEFLTQNPEEEAQAEAWYAQGFASLEAAAQSGSMICPIVETQGLKDRFAPATSLDISVIRLPSMVHHLEPVKRLEDEARITIGYGGDVRTGKGFDLLPGIVAAVLEKHPDARFDMRVAIDDPETVSGLLQRLRDFGTAVSLRTGSMAPLEFQTFLSTCDLILLPYDPEIYALRGSSICDEGEALGVPQVVPSNVSFAQKVLDAGAAQGFATYDAASVAKATCQALDHLDLLRRSASDLRARGADQNQQFLTLMRKRRG